MASDDDMNDNSSSNEDVTFISDDEDVTFISDFISDDEDDDDRDQNINKKSNLPKKYKILKAEDIKVCQQDNISEISNPFSIKIHEACTVLLHYRWHIDKITQDWLSDEQSVRRSVGLLENPIEVVKPKPVGLLETPGEVDEPKSKRKRSVGLLETPVEVDEPEPKRKRSVGSLETPFKVDKPKPRRKRSVGLLETPFEVDKPKPKRKRSVGLLETPVEVDEPKPKRKRSVGLLETPFEVDKPKPKRKRSVGLLETPVEVDEPKPKRKRSVGLLETPFEVDKPKPKRKRSVGLLETPVEVDEPKPKRKRSVGLLETPVEVGDPERKRKRSVGLLETRVEVDEPEPKRKGTVGLLEFPVELDEPGSKRKTACGICFDLYQIDKIVATPCAHPYCYTCWKKYISVAINDGPGCLFLKCPTPKCRLAVGVDMIDMLSSEVDKEKYNKYFLQSYVEDHYKNNMKWCPGPGCDYVIEYNVENERSSYDVTCLCYYQSCWNCGEDAHSPVSCDVVTKWLLKNRDESENTTWMLANTKPCPKCKRAIEKNQGCNHMTCKSPCRFQFCWVCLGDWSAHRSYYRCNHYSGKTGEEDQRERAKNFIERYAHYYERWITNEKSRKKAMEDLKICKENCEKKQGNELSVTSEDLKTITKAWLQVAECRRVLKWTYAYGYYISTKEVAKIEFFEYLQGEAEAGLERLHYCVEKELKNCLENKPNDHEFFEFKKRLDNLTKVTANYFNNLVKALENGLSDVNLHR